MVESLALPTTGRDLSAEAVDGLNEELAALRSLFDESEVALKGVYRAEKLIDKGLQKALIKGEVSEKHLGAADILRSSADEVAGFFDKRILLGTKATEFMSMLDEFLITRTDGTVLERSLNPSDVTESGKKRYKGDDKELPRLYVTGISGLPNYPSKANGRVVSTMYQPYRVSEGGGDFPFGVWVWPNDLEEWTNAGDEGTRFVDFFEDPKAKFVQNVRGAKLPSPKDYNPRYQIGMD